MSAFVINLALYNALGEHGSVFLTFLGISILLLLVHLIKYKMLYAVKRYAPALYLLFLSDFFFYFSPCSTIGIYPLILSQI